MFRTEVLESDTELLFSPGVRRVPVAELGLKQTLPHPDKDPRYFVFFFIISLGPDSSTLKRAHLGPRRKSPWEFKAVHPCSDNVLDWEFWGRLTVQRRTVCRPHGFGEPEFCRRPISTGH